MKKVMIVSFMLMFFSMMIAQNAKLKVYYFPRSPLYCLDTKQNPDGFLSEIVKLIFNNANVPFEFVNMPNKRVEANLQSGEYACGIGWLKKPEREQWAIFSNPIYQDQKLAVLINKKFALKNMEYTTIDELINLNLKLGIIDGFSYGSWADDKIKMIQNKELLAMEQDHLVMLLEKERFAYTFIGYEEGHWLLENNPNFRKNINLIKLTDAPEGNIRYIMFSKSVDKKIINKINSSIDSVKKSAKYNLLIKNYSK